MGSYCTCIICIIHAGCLITVCRGLFCSRVPRYTIFRKVSNPLCLCTLSGVLVERYTLVGSLESFDVSVGDWRSGLSELAGVKT